MRIDGAGQDTIAVDLRDQLLTQDTREPHYPRDL